MQIFPVVQAFAKFKKIGIKMAEFNFVANIQLG